MPPDDAPRFDREHILEAHRLALRAIVDLQHSTCIALSAADSLFVDDDDEEEDDEESSP